MIDKATIIEIQRLFVVEKWSIGAIASHLDIHHSTVSRHIKSVGIKRDVKLRPRMIDPYIPFIEETLARYHKITTSRLYQMAKARGYPGKERHFRTAVASLRPTPRKEAFLKLSSLPGEEAQVDWGHFGSIEHHGHERSLMAFVMVLSHSRAIFLHFFATSRMHCFLEGHERAFAWFEGVPRRCLYDNLRSVVIDRTGSTVRFNKEFLEFARCYRFEPRPVGVRRGNEKGRVERAIRYVRDNFFTARSYRDLADLNKQAHSWCQSVALQRVAPEDKSTTVKVLFEREKKRLLPLPEDIPSTAESLYVRIGKTPYARVDTNDYSVPPEYVGNSLLVKLSSTQVRLFSKTELVATHKRYWGKHKTINDLAHIEATRRLKMRGRESNALQVLTAACPSTSALMELLADQGEPLERATSRFFHLLHEYGASLLEQAMKEAVQRKNPHPNVLSVRLEQLREARNVPVKRRIITHNPEVDSMYINPPEMSIYDTLGKESEVEDE